MEQKIHEIINLISVFPEQFQPILLEILLKDHLEKQKKEIEYQPLSTSEISTDFILPIDVRAFFIQYNLNEVILKKLYLIERNQIVPLWQLKTAKKTEAQIQIALLLSFENALKTGVFEFSYEAVREKCKERIVYDSPNFATTFRTYKNYFKGFDDRDHIALSPEGKEKLANVLLELSEV